MNKIILTLLAGGKSSRMNFVNKSFIELNGIPLIEHLLQNVKKNDFLDFYIIANKDQKKYLKYSENVISDYFKDFRGPLSGLYSAMRHFLAKKNGECWFALMPTDTPFINKDYFQLIGKISKVTDKDCYIGEIDNKLEPLFSLWSSRIFEDLEYFLTLQDNFKILNFANQLGFEKFSIKKSSQYEFQNINSKDDLELIKKII